jgi:hypothetical protein
VQVSKGMVMNRQSFLENGLWSKEEYEGLLVSGAADQGRYNIGIEIGEDLILVVDQVMDSEVQQKVRSWSAEIADIQRQYSWT